MTRRFRLIVPLALAIMALTPALAQAQRRGGVRAVRAPQRAPVVVVGGYSRPYWFYDPWYQWGPYPYPYPYGYGYGFRDDLTASLRLEISPREAEVFVDGYRAGVVDDFDGFFQRLRLRPGGHDLVVYLEGYRTIHESLYLSPGSDRKLQDEMEPLAAGQVSEPPPSPADVAAGGPALPPPDQAPAPPDRQPAPPDRRPAAGSVGTLSLRVQPAEAEVLIDGASWSSSAGNGRTEVQLAAGRHHVVVRAAGFTPWEQDVLVRRDATLALNVSLLGGDDRP